LASRRVKAALIAGGILLPLALLELGARIVSPFAVPRLALFRPEPRLGYELEPGLEARGPRGERIRVGRDGFRGDEQPPVRSTDFEVLALGDSFMFGLGVEDDETFPAALQRALSQQRPARIRNGGVPGYNLLQSVTRLERSLEEPAPDAVVLGFLENDLHNVDGPDNEVALDGTLRPASGSYRPAASVNPFQALSGPWLWLQLHSAAFRLASFAAIQQRLALEGDEELAALAADAERSSELGDRLLRGESDEETEPRFAAAERLLERAAEKTRAAGVTLVLVVFPRPEQLVSERLRGGSRRIAEIARAKEIVVVDPTEVLAAEPDRIGLYLFPHDHHPSARGYEKMAAEVASRWPRDGATVKPAGTPSPSR
jgi:lysophospholipase L1-like esterase